MMLAVRYLNACDLVIDVACNKRINAIKNLGVEEPKNIAKYTLVSGVFAGIALGVVYLALSFVGAQTSSAMAFENGGQLLADVTYRLLGNGGRVVLGVAVLLACLVLNCEFYLINSLIDYFLPNDNTHLKLQVYNSNPPL